MTQKPVAMREALLEAIWREMAKDSGICFISADFGSPILDYIRKDFPDRFVNVGIAEQNLINISTGMALEGFKVFAYAIAPFITMRCFEQIRINLAMLSELRELNVNLIGVGAGYSYVMSGPSHQCYEDISLMRTLPNMQFLSPADSICAAKMVTTCLAQKTPKYLRLDAQLLPSIYDQIVPQIAKGFHHHRQGDKTCLIATGYMVHSALKLAQFFTQKGIDLGIIDLFDLTQFNEAQFGDILKNYDGIITLEEGFKARGGLDSLLFNFITRNQLNLRILNLGVENDYRFDLGTRDDLHEQVGIGHNIMIKKIEPFLKA